MRGLAIRVFKSFTNSQTLTNPDGVSLLTFRANSTSTMLQLFPKPSIVATLLKPLGQGTVYGFKDAQFIALTAIEANAKERERAVEALHDYFAANNDLHVEPAAEPVADEAAAAALEALSEAAGRLASADALAASLKEECDALREATHLKDLELQQMSEKLLAAEARASNMQAASDSLREAIHRRNWEHEQTSETLANEKRCGASLRKACKELEARLAAAMETKASATTTTGKRVREEEEEEEEEEGVPDLRGKRPKLQHNCVGGKAPRPSVGMKAPRSHPDLEPKAEDEVLYSSDDDSGEEDGELTDSGVDSDVEEKEDEDGEDEEEIKALSPTLSTNVKAIVKHHQLQSLPESADEIDEVFREAIAKRLTAIAPFVAKKVTSRSDPDRLKKFTIQWKLHQKNQNALCDFGYSVAETLEHYPPADSDTKCLEAVFAVEVGADTGLLFRVRWAGYCNGVRVSNTASGSPF